MPPQVAVELMVEDTVVRPVLLVIMEGKVAMVLAKIIVILKAAAAAVALEVVDLAQMVIMVMFIAVVFLIWERVLKVAMVVMGELVVAVLEVEEVAMTKMPVIGRPTMVKNMVAAVAVPAIMAQEVEVPAELFLLRIRQCI